MLFLTGCSYFDHDKPIATKPVHNSKQVINQSFIESCDQSCYEKSGLKKNICFKKCQNKQNKAEKQALRHEKKSDHKRTSNLIIPH